MKTYIYSVLAPIVFGQTWTPYGDKFPDRCISYTTVTGYPTNKLTEIQIFKASNGCISGLKFSGIAGSDLTACSQSTAASQAPHQSLCSTNQLCLTQSILSTQHVVEITATANSNSGGTMYCIDSLTFKTDDNVSFGCDARASTSIQSYNTQSQTWTSTSLTKQLYQFRLETWSDCQVDWITPYEASGGFVVQPCSSPADISLDAQTINGLSQQIGSGQTLVKTVIASSGCSNVEYALGITPTPSTTNLITLSTGSTPTITFAASFNTLDANDYSVTLQARFTGQTTWTKTSGPFTYKYQYDFCLDTSLNWASSNAGLSIMTMSLLAAGPMTQTASQITDSYSFLSGDVTGTQFCEAREFTITSVISGMATQSLSATELSIDTNTGVISLFATNSATIGTHTATVVGKLASYPTVAQVSASFTIIINPCILNVKAPLIKDQVYLLSSSPLEIHYEPFQILPDGYDPGPSWIQVYVSSETPDEIDLNSPLLISSSQLDWITHDQAAGIVTIQTYNSANVGEHSILVVQFFDNFPDEHHFSAFKLTINPLPVFVAPTIRKAPYLATPLVQQNVTQCSGLKSDLWSFVLPKPIDPNNKEVTIKIAFDATFFQYEASTQTIKQLKVVQKPINQTVYVTLSNELDLKGTYSMRVEFSCNKTNDFVFNFSYAVLFDKVKRQTYWPQAKISQIEPNGLMHVRFNRLMKIPDNPELIQNDTIFLNETVYPIIKIDVLPGKYSDPNNLKLNWTFKEFNPTELLIQLWFETPSFVSSQRADLDSIRLTFYGFQFFKDNLGNFMLPPTTTNSKSLPQIISASQIAAAQSLASTTQNVINSVMIANTVATMAIAGPLQQILNSVKQLQIVVHIFLINVAYPAVVPLIFGVLMNLLTFQVIDLQEFYNKILRLDSDSEGNQPMNDQFDLMGYSSHYIIQNFGTLMLTFAVLFTAMALSPLGAKLFKNRLVWIRHRLRNFRFTNYWLRFLNETYLFLAVCTALNFGYFKWGSYGEAFNTLMALLFASLLVFFTGFVIIFFRTKQNQKSILEHDEEFFNRFGSVIEGLNFKRRGRDVLIYVITVLIRKLSFAYFLVFQYKKPVFNIVAVTLQALLVIGVSGTIEPMTDRTANILDLINESFVLVYTYHLYPLTDFVTDFQARDYVGNSLVILAFLNITINLGSVTVRNIREFVRKIKLKWLKWKQTRAIQKSKDQRLARFTKRQESSILESQKQQASNPRSFKAKQFEESESENSSFSFDYNEDNSSLEEAEESGCDFYTYLRRQDLSQKPRILEVGDVVYLQDSDLDEVYGQQLELNLNKENHLSSVNQIFQSTDDSYQFQMPAQWYNLPKIIGISERDRLRKELEFERNAIKRRDPDMPTHYIRSGPRMFDQNQVNHEIGEIFIQQDEESYPNQRHEEVKNYAYQSINQPIFQQNLTISPEPIRTVEREAFKMERQTEKYVEKNESTVLAAINGSYQRSQQPTQYVSFQDPSLKYGFPDTKSSSNPTLAQNEAYLISVKPKQVHSLLFQQIFAQRQQVDPVRQAELSPRSFRSPLQQLTEIHPGVEASILSIRKSEVHSKVIEVREVKYSGRVIRYSVLSDGYEVNQFLVRKHFDAKAIQTQLQNAEDRALELTRDCPWWVKSDIVSGKFQRELDRYKIARQQFMRQGQAGGHKIIFTDLGDCDSQLDLNQRIRLYIQLQQLTEQVGR